MLDSEQMGRNASARKHHSRMSKKEKRHSRRESFLERAKPVGIEKKKRRRPSKKLKADFGTLANQLDEIAIELEHPQSISRPLCEPNDGQETSLKNSGTIYTTLKDEQSRIPMISTKHRPGALKRRRVMNAREVDRFHRNLAQMSGEGHDNSVGQHSMTMDEFRAEAKGSLKEISKSDKWVALRNFIGATMEKSSAFSES